MIKQKSKISIFLLLTLIVSSCNSLDKDEYKILNAVIGMHVHPEVDTVRINKILENDNIDYLRAVDIVNEEMSKKHYEFVLSDTIYPVILPPGLKEDLHTKLLFSEIENRSDKPLVADFNQLKFKNNLQRVPKAINSTNYIGQFRLHRVLFDKTRESLCPN